MRRFAIAVFTGLLGFGAPQAQARTNWLCGLSEDILRLVCVAEAGPQDVQDPAPAPRAVVNGTAFPLDPRRQYTVELLAPAGEMEFVEQLARATMCYRTPECTVSFAGPRVQATRVAARPAR
jgi:hypothetical protein